ncbi:MAG: M28 family peptidase [Candidatus Thermoplasmatota archaeon]|jgi:hypothetical protein
MRTRPIAALALAALLAGCLQADDASPQIGQDTTEPNGPLADPAAFLAGLATPTLPDAARCLNDLESFVALAPRRYENQFQHAEAKDWLEAQFTAAGLQVTRQDFDGSSQQLGQAVPGQNILAVKPGRDPTRLLVFGAHYDSAVTAYGAAYDDGSGTLLVVELARAMAAYDWQHTLVFAEWDQEEGGLVGSAAHVQSLIDQGFQVDLAVNFDMAGINWPAKFGGTVDVPVKADFGGGNAEQFAAAWTAVVDHLGQPAASSAVATTEATSGPSDHGSFLAGDLPAVWVRGAVIGNYPMYHGADTVEGMILDVGGERADLVAGFDTVLRRTFLFTFLADRTAPAPAAAEDDA